MRRAKLLIAAAAVIALVAAVSDSAGAQGSAEEVVLGGLVYGAPNGEGWGGERPGTIFDGGDPSGLVSEAAPGPWVSWSGHRTLCQAY